MYTNSLNPNESEIFEDNDIFIVGTTLSQNITLIKNEFNLLFEQVHNRNTELNDEIQIVLK
jgi:hypothetical protein